MADAGYPWKPTIQLQDGPTRQMMQSLQKYLEIAAQLPHTQSTQIVPGGADFTVSLTYVNWPTLAPLKVLAFKKYRNDSVLKVHLAGGGNVKTTTGFLHSFAVNVNGSDFLICALLRTDAAAGNHLIYSGEITIPNIPAGTYDLTARAKTSNVTGGPGTDGNDVWNLVVTEMMP